MKVARLVCTVFAMTQIAGWATGSFACDKDKTSAAGTVYQASVTGKTTTATTAAAHDAGACSAEMAAKCTPEMAAACKAKMGKTTAFSASANGSCAAKGASATAVTASANGSCAAKGASATAVTASANGSGAAKATAVLAASSGSEGCCASKGAKASAASGKSAGTCAMKGATTTAAAAGACTAHGFGAMAANNLHDDCEACLDMTSCSDALDAAGAHRQAVRLKNGVMYVYTADTQRNVSAVQAAVARRGQHMAQFAAAGDKARLCSECKSMRGAMASGKLTREVVNIEGGSLTLITSTDPAIVAKIHAMAEPKLVARAKS